MAGYDLVFGFQQAFDEWIVDFAPSVPLAPVFERLEPAAVYEDTAVHAAQKRHVGPLHDHDGDTFEAEGLVGDKIGVVVHERLFDRSSTVPGRVHVGLKDVHTDFDVGSQPVRIGTAARVVRTGREHEIVVLAQHDGGETVLAKLIGQGVGSLGFARTGFTGDGYDVPAAGRSNRAAERIGYIGCHSAMLLLDDEDVTFHGPTPPEGVTTRGRRRCSRQRRSSFYSTLEQGCDHLALEYDEEDESG